MAQHKRTDSKDVPWYNGDIGVKLGPKAREILQGYAKIPSSELESHVSVIRDKAWEIHPYPCIGQYRFLDFSITLSPHYPTLLSHLKDNEGSFLDLGCGFGQDLRALVADGVPSQQCYAADLRREFWDLGYELFYDKETLKSEWIQTDVLAPLDSQAGLQQLKGKVDVIYAGSLLHLFDYGGQVKVCELIVELLKPVKGSCVLGRQVGNVVAGETPRRVEPEKMMFRHNAESFRKMWDDVGEKMGCRWRVEVVMGDGGRLGSSRWDPDFRDLQFAVFRE